jgi:3-hydroxyacyl-CoA dehydrogenase/enoyl-CoA hydratase/3-hydroxybutyryl-CoA epimerase
LRGLNVTLQDRELRFVEPALARAQALFSKRLGTSEERGAAARLGCGPTCRARGCRCADIVIEAIFEDLASQTGTLRSGRAAHAPGRGAGQQYLEPDT